MKLFDNNPVETANQAAPNPFADMIGMDTQPPLASAAANPFADLQDSDVELALERIVPTTQSDAPPPPPPSDPSTSDEPLNIATVRDVHDRQILRELAQLLPYETARDNKAILLQRQTDGTFYVGMCNHDNFLHKTNVARAMRVPASVLRPRVLLPQRWEKLIEEAYDLTVAQTDDRSNEASEHRDQTTVDWSQIEINVDNSRSEAAGPEIAIGTGTGLRAQAERIILDAIAHRASDVHIVPQLKAGYILFRTDGELYKAYENIPPARMENLANAFCDMARVNAYQVAHTEVGRDIPINIRTASGNIERRTLRFQGMPALYGRLIVIRIQSNDFRDFDMIGLEDSQITQIQNALYFKKGLCLVTGGTGSGKSNTLEAMLRRIEEIRPGRVNIIQIGNPVEFPHEEREQIPLKTAKDWDRFFEATLRCDPDILSPGEFRNSSEAAIVFQGAATGHLTLTTLHTNNVAETCTRLDFLGIERDKQSSLLKLIVSQELVPLLCPHCKEPDPRAPEIVDNLVNYLFPNRPDLREALHSLKTLPFFRRVGCRRCNQRGIKLRTCIAEIMTITPDISFMLRNRVDGQEIVNHAVRRHGMTTFAEAATRKLCRGLIDYNDVLHLLMSASSDVAPENTTYSWQSQPSVENEPLVNEDEPIANDYIDAEVEYVEDAETETRAAA